MSDQHVVTDWRAYFAALRAASPSNPMSAEAIEAMKAAHVAANGPAKTMLLINNAANFVNGAGGLLEMEEVEAGITIENAKGYWDAMNPGVPRPEMWLQRSWPGGATEYIAPEPIVKQRKAQGKCK